MIRTQIYIHQQTHQKLLWLTKSKGSSMAELVRKFIEEGLEKETVDRSGRDVMRALANIKATGGPEDLSRNLDHYLYGGPKKDEK